MKKLLTTLVLTGFICTAFAQQAFKPIHFSAINTKNKDLTTDRQFKGTINISIKDSVIVIDDGELKKYKIKEFATEQTATTDQQITVKWLAFSCTAKDNNAPCTIQLVRQTQSGKNDEMQLLVEYDENNALKYYCDYQKEL